MTSAEQAKFDQFNAVLIGLGRGEITPDEAVRIYVSRGMCRGDALTVVGISIDAITGDVAEEDAPQE